MNYRHIYHAGNFADVFKHAITVTLLEALTVKPKPLVYIDTHAGIGGYDLTQEEALRSQEYQQGIVKLLNEPTVIPELFSYLTLIRKYSIAPELSFYPGSPVVAQAFLREIDRMILNEFHPEDYKQLKKNVGNRGNIHCHQRDAYEFLPAILPPNPARALILIDPPYEKISEFDDLFFLVKKSLTKFAHGIYAIWYPIVDERHHAFISRLLQSLHTPTLHAWLTRTSIQPERQGLIGTGMIIINPPWQIEHKIMPITEFLGHLFKLDAKARFHVESFNK
ncbi:MAG: 23S rRNA (adenine(2030)-N(6))-methyltransferase RlmJ [Legionellales bacterium]|nr:23S rRNA (adenine(2030)-N(6))-methyltransferase RlmJ [Legionellales bacterium]